MSEGRGRSGASMAGSVGTLLVVDDDAANRDLMARCLARSGFTVGTAASGREALEYIDTHATELVLLDSEMPEMSGLAILEEIRRTRSSSVLAVVMVTAWDDTRDIVEALSRGADDYITKPVDFDLALARIRTQLSRKRAEDCLRESEERYALAMNGANDGLWDWDLATGRTYFSPRWKAIVGAQDDEVGEEPREWFDRVHPSDLQRVREALGAHLAGDSSRLECEHRIRHQSGAFRWVLVRGLAVRNADGVAVRIAGSQVDLTVGKVLDPLTGLPNQLMLNEQLERALAHQPPHGTKRCALLLFGIDGLKLINDSLGHQAGDQLIRSVAKRLESSLRSTDVVVRTGAEPAQTMPLHLLTRVGGDEFIILLPDVERVLDVTLIAERLQQAMTSPFEVSGRQIFATASIGIAVSRAEGSCQAELLRDADTAMHRAKLSGSGRSEVFDPTMREEVQQRLDLETDLRLGIGRDEFIPYFQPIIDVTTGRLAGFEALLRWRHPNRGVVSPAGFISVIEANGLIVPVGLRCFEQVCWQVREWLDTYACPDRFWVSVNFSRRQLLQEGLVPRLLGCLEEAHLSPAHIAIEVTESLAVENLDLTTRVLRQLGEAGLKVLLDDFGTGHSSLVCLHQLPIAGLKLDRTLLLATEAHPALLGTVVALASSLGLTVTAEGIETKEQWERAMVGGCDFAQGFLFGAPVDAAHAAAFIVGNRTWRPSHATPVAVRVAGMSSAEPLRFVGANQP